MKKMIMLLLLLAATITAKADNLFLDVGANRAYTAITSTVKSGYDTTSGFVGIGYNLNTDYLSYNLKGLYLRSNHNNNLAVQINAEYMFLEKVGFQLGLNVNNPIQNREYFSFSNPVFKLGHQLEVNYKHNPEVTLFISQQEMKNQVGYKFNEDETKVDLDQKNHLIGLRYNF